MMQALRALGAVLVLAGAVHAAIAPGVKARYKEGVDACLAGRYDEAIATWRGLLNDRASGLPLSAKVKIVRCVASAYQRSGDLEQAFKWIELAYRRAPEDPRVNRTRDDILAKRIKPVVPTPTPTPTPTKPAEPPPPTAAEAKQAFADGEQLFKEGQTMVEQASDAAEPEKKFAAAIEKLSVAVRGDYRRPRALFLLGSSYLFRNDTDAKDLDHARDRLEESLKLDDDKNTRFNLASVYGLLGDTAQQIVHLEKAVEMDPECAECHFRLAIAYDKSGRDDAPARTFEHAKSAIRLHPDNKRRFQGVLKNSEVAKKIAEWVTKIIKESEDDTLTDDKVDKYAGEIDKMLGPGATGKIKKDLKDKGGVKGFIQSKDGQDILKNFKDGQDRPLALPSAAH